MLALVIVAFASVCPQDARADREAALADARRALEAREHEFGPEAPETAVAVRALASALESLGRYPEAESLYRRAVAIRETAFGPDHVLTARSLNDLAGINHRLGRFARAESLARRVLAIREVALGPEHAGTAVSLDNLALYEELQGKYADAEPLYRRALAIWEKARGPEHVDTAVCLDNLAGLLKRQGRHRDAEPLYRRALAIWEQADGGRNPGLATCLNNFAFVLGAQGKVDEAEAMLRRALAICETAYGADHPTTAIALTSLANVLATRGGLPEAERDVRRALAIREAVFGPGHFRTASSLSILAAILRKRSLFVEAEQLLRRALAINERTLGEDHPANAEILVGLFSAVFLQGRVDDAEPIARRATAIRRRLLGFEHPDTATAIECLLFVHGSRGEVDAASELAAQVVESSLGHLGSELLVASPHDRFAFAASLENRLDRLLSCATDADDVCYAALTAWKGIVFRSAVRMQEQLARGATSAQRRLASQLQQTRTALSRLAFARGVPDADAHAARIAGLLAAKRRLEAALARSLGMDPRRERTSARALATLLPERSALVDFSIFTPFEFVRVGDDDFARQMRWGERRLLAWVTRAGEPSVLRVDLGPADAARDATEAFLAGMLARRGRRPGRDALAANDRLRKLLWDPLVAALADSRMVFVSPEGFLGRLPFETLQLEDRSFLIERRGFVYVQDAVTLARLLEAPPAPRQTAPKLVVVGGVDYDARAEHGAAAAPPSPTRGGFERYWTPLSGTAQEAEGVSAFHRKALGPDAPRLLLAGADATEERVEQEAPSAQVLHLATHGFFEPAGVPSLWDLARASAKDPGAGIGAPPPDRREPGMSPGLLSGLVLAGANEPPAEGREDGYLTAEEVVGLDLRACELVVLSACETGLGTTRGGQGMLSARRAFHEAGARSVISSLWDVRDDSARTLMLEFYRRAWQERESPLSALRGAQLRMLELDRKRDPSRPRPSTWGAFVLSGDWR